MKTGSQCRLPERGGSTLGMAVNMKRLLSVLVVLLLFGAPPLQANSLTKSLRNSGLSPEDIEIMTGQAASLYTSRSLRIGDKAEWKNDDSGTIGSVEILAIEGNCVKLGHVFTTSKRNKPQRMKLRRCKDADGNWIMN